MIVAFWFSAAVLAVLLRQLFALRSGLRQLRQLAAAEPATDADLPSLSIVVSALNEATTIEPALRSLLALDHPRLQVVAIDDRSTDGTGDILDRLAQEDPRLRVIRVRELPAGWLGKVHALHLGAQAATGNWLLFTDADVHFAPGALRRALGHCLLERLDHLAVLPQLHVREPLLAALLLESQALFYAALPPWKLATSRDVYVGLGAFNLVRADVYQRAGGHAAVRLEVLDDLVLGKQLKAHGARQGLLLGEGTVALEWYADARAFMHGVEKNSFAALEYSVPRALAASVAVLALRTWPLIALFTTTGATRWINALAVAVGLAIVARVWRTTSWSARCLAWFPLAPVAMVAILWRAIAITLRRGGIVWRGTRYPLAALRAARAAQRVRATSR